jgi:hypothetical protein
MLERAGALLARNLVSEPGGAPAPEPLLEEEEYAAQTAK